MSLSTQLAFLAALVVGALGLHELVFVFSGTGAGSEHGYLATLAPMLVAASLAALLAAVLLPSLGSKLASSTRPRLSPLPVAAALAVIFFAQEATEALLGGGVGGFAASLMAAWSLPALALLLASMIVAAVSVLHRLGDRLASLIGRERDPRPARSSSSSPMPAQPLGRARPPMASGLASRPPPLTA